MVHKDTFVSVVRSGKFFFCILLSFFTSLSFELLFPFLILFLLLCVLSFLKCNSCFFLKKKKEGSQMNILEQTSYVHAFQIPWTTDSRTANQSSLSRQRRSEPNNKMGPTSKKALLPSLPQRALFRN